MQQSVMGLTACTHRFRKHGLQVGLKVEHGRCRMLWGALLQVLQLTCPYIEIGGTCMHLC